MKKVGIFLFSIITIILGCSDDREQEESHYLYSTRLIRAVWTSGVYVTGVELSDGHDYFVANNASSSSGVAITHAAGCRFCKISKE